MLVADDWIGFYWGPRMRSRMECAESISIVLKAIHSVDPHMCQWYWTGADSACPTITNDTCVDVIAERLEYQKDDNWDEAMTSPELGFYASMYCKGADESYVALTSTCGQWCKWLPNNCVLQPPSPPEARDKFMQYEKIHDICRAMIRVWEPDHGLVASHKMHDQIGKNEKPIDVGWFTYRKGFDWDASSLGDAITVERVDDKGLLFITSDHVPQYDDPKQIEIMKKLNRLLALK